MDDAVRYVLDMLGCRTPSNGGSLLGASLSLGASDGKGDDLHIFVNESMIINTEKKVDRVSFVVCD